jgi:hypothetical protein
MLMVDRSKTQRAGDLKARTTSPSNRLKKHIHQPAWVVRMNTNSTAIFRASGGKRRKRAGFDINQSQSDGRT